MDEDTNKDFIKESDMIENIIEDMIKERDLVRVDQVVQLWVLHPFLGMVKSNANLSVRMNGKIYCFCFSNGVKELFRRKGGGVQKWFEEQQAQYEQFASI